jgi:hypothetical protein
MNAELVLVPKGLPKSFSSGVLTGASASTKDWILLLSTRRNNQPIPPIFLAPLCLHTAYGPVNGRQYRESAKEYFGGG